MNLFLAAVYSNNYMKGQNRYVKLTDVERSIMHSVPNILESFHYVNKQPFVDAMRDNGAHVFLDSGAFSAHTLGVEIDIEVYCQYIQRNMDIFRTEEGVLMVAVLDGIGDAQLTYENQIRMEQLGVKPVPCFHTGEDPRYLDWYVENYEYISLGGLVGASTKQLTTWLDRVWNNHLLDGSGNPKIKVHGFGITSVPIMDRYPWHSCDSSSWIQNAAFGNVFTADYGPLSVSEKSPARFDRGQHVANMNTLERELITAYFTAKGFDEQRLATVYESRAAACCLGYMELNSKIDAQNNARDIVVQELF